MEEIYNEDSYGHLFRGDIILLIWIDNVEANYLYKKARGRNTDTINFSMEVKDVSLIPDHIYCRRFLHRRLRLKCRQGSS